MNAATYDLRRPTDQDLDAILRLNRLGVPGVNEPGRDFFAWAVREADHFQLAEHQGEPAAMLLALAPGRAYDSPNYRWFTEHYSRFLFIDRIIVDPAHRRRGLASRLYALAAHYAQGLAPVLGVDINLDNAMSLAFHARLGFVQAGRHLTEGGTKDVGLFVKVLDPDPAAQAA